MNKIINVQMETYEINIKTDIGYLMQLDHVKYNYIQY